MWSRKRQESFTFNQDFLLFIFLINLVNAIELSVDDYFMDTLLILKLH